MGRSAWIRLVAMGLMLAGMLASAPARAERTIASVLFVSKSENRNQVHYGIHLEDSCAFSGSAPVYAYWRMLDKGGIIEPLLAREQQAYGIARQEVQGDTVRITLRALPQRPITLRITRGADGTCNATAETPIAGRRARLYNIHVALGFLRVDHVVLQGWSEPEGLVVNERLAP